MVRRAVVVTRDLDRGARWIGWLRAAGYTATGCAGPDVTPSCPRARGVVCHHRDDAVVVVVDGSSDVHAICGAPDAGRSVVLFPDEPEAGDRRAFLLRLADQPVRRRS